MTTSPTALPALNGAPPAHRRWVGLMLVGLLTSPLALAQGAGPRAFPTRTLEPALSEPAAPLPAAELHGRSWALTALPGHKLPVSNLPNFRLESARVSGSDGCNRYAGPFSSGGPGLVQFGPELTATMMGCPAQAQVLATAFAAVMLRATRYQLEGSALSLLDNQTRVLAQFSPLATELVGSRWQVVNFNNGKEAVVSVLAGSTLTLSFLQEGRVIGQAGCNSFGGTAKIQNQGQQLSLGDLATTRKVCFQPEGLMAQEAAYLKALDNVASGRREGDLLTLRDDDGALAATLQIMP
ncbi:META domain-containing protein [Ideonella sp.]|uniref:META domain-containing protein n=1 Tax=Ideonella sp. TaxID=1929293 RepID=UPI003BB4B926